MYGSPIKKIRYVNYLYSNYVNNCLLRREMRDFILKEH